MPKNEATSIMNFGTADVYRKQVEQQQDPAAIFKAPREPGDFDFIAEVRGLLIMNGVTTDCLQAFDTARLIQDATHMRPDAQRHLVNRFFRGQILSIRDTDTIAVRTCLIDSGEYSDWMRLFKESVVPFLIQNSLPRQLF